jgi:methyltransferase-like protein
MAEDITEQEAQEILRSFNEGKQNIHSFLTNVVKAPDTTKTGNLNQDELGHPKIPVRTYKELELFCNDVWNQKENWGTYFNKMSEIQTSTSLSKDAILLKLSATLRKELADVSPERKEIKENKGWFKSNKQENIQS